MDLILKLQAYFRHTAQQQYEAVPVPPFTLFFNPNTDLKYLNYAIPDMACSGDLTTVLAELRQQFKARRRLPRFEFIESFAPDLPPALRQAGFIEEYRGPLMICTPTSYRPVPEIPGVTMITLDGNSPTKEIRDFTMVQRQGFNPAEVPVVTDAEIDDWRRGLGEGRAFLAYLDGQAASAGQYTPPFDGLVELVGIATLEPFRRKGLAAALTAQAVQTAFAAGVEVACLSAGDEAASRVYQRAGFYQAAVMLAYSDPDTV